MINVCVYRYPCSVIDEDCGQASALCKSGDEVTDGLIVSEEGARARGTEEINTTYTSRLMISGNMYLVPWVQPGEVVQVTDNEKGIYRAMVRGMSIHILRSGQDKATATAAVQLEKQLDESDY